MERVCSWEILAMIRSRMVWPLALLTVATGFVHGQQDVPPGYVFHVNQEVRVRDLSPQAAPSTNTTAVLISALEAIFHGAEVCCGKNSALEDGAEAADPLSLKDVSAKLQGKHLSNDGRPITVSTEYMASDSINPGQIVSCLLGNRALLMEWKSRLYVVYGAGFDESSITAASGTISFTNSSCWTCGFRTRAERLLATARATIGGRCKDC
jgi:hypothetical protein